MFAKIVCLLASFLAHVYACLPPPASETTNKKTDMISDEYWMKKLDQDYLVPVASVAWHLLQIATYIYLMTTSQTSSLLAVQQLAIF